MSSLLQRILNLTHKTFSPARGAGDLNEHIAKLTDLVKGFSLNDISFDQEFLDDECVHEAPIGYVPLWESSYFSMGIFIVRKDQRLPLHNHPGMHGILKVIHGTANIQSFTITNEGTPL